ncbi:MAG TPA: FecR domain-containing protein [Methylobacterium sp.]|uniref:FecR family protein n=1 Tax=Methylorubrum sp. B1-46 TaxID=2897334 RepID=UPI001E503C9D|nr:FecR domain-containing protein [Methylorubrum sp. B1-46]UGB24955.1 FecR domain-containing protein [Methylorubrum sp. B1-46]HEV2545128.1 FecR domain-containing protein [Methylobacterium sp.]
MAGSDGAEADGIDDGDDPIERAAAAWVARLSSSDATEADHRAFEAWREADPAHAAAYAEMDALWRRLGQLPDPRPRRGPLEEPAKGPPEGSLKGSPKGSPKTLSGLAALALIGGGLAYEVGLLDRLRADLWSDVGTIAHATLPDGSGVALNTDTAIAVRFTAQERGIALLRGEASFDVVPDPNRPFVVRGGGLSVRAVGTRFFLRADGAGRPVGVAEGRVDVSGPSGRAVVSAGEEIRVGGGALQVAAADVERDLAWRDGRLIFAGRPLAAVLAELDRYRRGRIVLLDSRLGERRVTGAFDARNTDEALDVIAATMGARIRRLSPLLVLVGSPL